MYIIACLVKTNTFSNYIKGNVLYLCKTNDIKVEDWLPKNEVDKDNCIILFKNKFEAIKVVKEEIEMDKKDLVTHVLKYRIIKVK